ncbi:MAG: glycogen synthase GlgA [Candidatus Aminicenantia bacterium]
MRENLRVLIVSSEIVPFVKTGGLGDVVGALAKNLENLGVDVSIALPKYKRWEIEEVAKELCAKELEVKIGNELYKGSILKGTTGTSIDVYFVDNPSFFYRDELYGMGGSDYPDNDKRFIFFSLSLLEFIKKKGLHFDIIHCNDWQTALIPAFIKLRYNNNIPTLFTIHNLAYKGLFPPETIQLAGFGWNYFTPEVFEYYGQFCFLKGGIKFSDVINTVSERYAQEIQTPEFGEGLDGVLRNRSDSLFGILNGVDYDVWNPSTDPYLKTRYTSRSLWKKRENKEDLIKECGLEIDIETPLIGMITRLVEQKGFDILLSSIDELFSINIGMVILGKGNEYYEKALKEKAKKYKGKLCLKIEFNEGLAHKIEGGADMFLMPSKYEPCGLNQLYSMKYGTVPIVRAVGGLYDSVKEYNPEKGTGNGFRFEKYDRMELVKAVKRALKLYKDKKKWEKLMRNCMKEDFSWEKSAKKYIKLYELAISKVKGENK